jgi:hypothetical protein
VRVFVISRTGLHCEIDAKECYAWIPERMLEFYEAKWRGCLGTMNQVLYGS